MKKLLLIKIMFLVISCSSTPVKKEINKHEIDKNAAENSENLNKLDQDP